MISNYYLFFAFVTALVWSIKFAETRLKSRFFEIVPSIVVIYFFMMVVGNLHIVDKTMLSSLGWFKTYLLSSMIILMLTKSDMKSIYQMKLRLLASFLTATFSIMAGFVIMWALFGRFFDHSAYKAFGALSASWIGGTANMIAVASVVGADNELLGYCLVTDAVNYALWVMILLFAAGYRDRFNNWSGGVQNEPSRIVNMFSERKSDNVYAMIFGLGAPFAIIYISGFLPNSGFMGDTFWSVTLSTILGVLLSFTPLSKNSVSSKVGFWFLYFIIAMAACGASFDDFSKAPFFIFAGAFVILTHALIMLIYAKVTRTDLFTVSVSSLANIGGVASAPVLAASYSNNLIGVGVVMAMLGYIVGTFGGLFVTYVLGLM